jgi:hypothetical protein
VVKEESLEGIHGEDPRARIHDNLMALGRRLSLSSEGEMSNSLRRVGDHLRGHDQVMWLVRIVWRSSQGA